MTKISTVQDTCDASVCTKSVEAIHEEKLLWPIFGCKVGQSDLIVMKLDVCRCLLDVYAKFQIDVSKHVQKAGKLFAGWEPY